jgi:tetratricopeptide (TPR) repeat protein
MRSQTFLCLLLFTPLALAQEAHDHGVPEKLGEVLFPISCSPSVQSQFNRAVALLHSFAYSAANQAFQAVAAKDPKCAMAHWGAAMTYYRQLWDPPLLSSTFADAQKEIRSAQQIGTSSDRERQFIQALSAIYLNTDTAPYSTRAVKYEDAMRVLAESNSSDVEAQVFYALALLANAPPTDRTHTNQKKAVALLEPLYLSHPQHPGIPHYLIHACDNQELAQEGLPAARVYAQIAPSAPHALHMPSHIFTRLGLWDNSIASNIAARDAARQQHDTGEELHAMDYLVYAYLQAGRSEQALQVIQRLNAMPDIEASIRASDFKSSYAATAMPIRYAVERSQWDDAAKIVPPTGAPLHVVAIAFWSRGVGLARTGHPTEAAAAADPMRKIEEQLRKSGNDYWATQVKILAREVIAWSAQAAGRPDEAVTLMRASADEEDAIEKLPVTPGPIIPAREQLGDLLLQQGHAEMALIEFQTSLKNAPGRRGSTQGVAQASEIAGRN